LCFLARQELLGNNKTGSENQTLETKQSGLLTHSVFINAYELF